MAGQLAGSPRLPVAWGAIRTAPYAYQIGPTPDRRLRTVLDTKIRAHLAGQDHIGSGVGEASVWVRLGFSHGPHGFRTVEGNNHCTEGNTGKIVDTVAKTKPLRGYALTYYPTALIVRFAASAARAHR